MKKYLVKFATKFQLVWKSIPEAVKVIIYLVASGLLTALQTDLLELRLENSYLVVLQTGTNNFILYLLQRLSGKVAEIEEV